MRNDAPLGLDLEYSRAFALVHFGRGGGAGMAITGLLRHVGSIL